MDFFNNLMKSAVKNAASDLGATFSIAKQVGSGIRNLYNGVMDAVSDVGTGLQNWWYSNTGRSYLTDDYQHEEELANTAYQRAAEDMEKAGLSKFYGVGSASSPTPQAGSGLLATAMALQQLKAGKLAIDEQSYNLNKAKSWGVPTGAVDEFAKYDAVAQLLFGKSIPSIAGSDGILGRIGKWLFGEGEPSFWENLSNFFGAGNVDMASNIMSEEGKTLTPQPRVSSDASGPYADVFDQFSHNINAFVKGHYGKYVPKDVSITHDQIRDTMKGALNSLMVDYDLPFDAAANIVNSWTLKMLGNWQGIQYDLFITGHEFPSSPVPSSTSDSGFAGGGKGGGGAHTW